MRYSADSPQMPFCTGLPFPVIGKALYESLENDTSFSANDKFLCTSDSSSQTVAESSLLPKESPSSIGVGILDVEPSLANGSFSSIGAGAEHSQLPLLQEHFGSFGDGVEHSQPTQLKKSFRPTETGVNYLKSPLPHEPFSSVGVGVEDEQLQKAARESEASGSVLPIIKQELKYKILSQRLSRGEEDIDVEFTPKPECPLTPEEIERKNRRKESNRKSARKCRLKKKRSRQELKKDLLLEEQRHRKLLQDIATLTKQKEFLSSKLPSALTQMCSTTADMVYGQEQNYSYRSESPFNLNIAAAQFSLLVT